MTTPLAETHGRPATAGAIRQDAGDLYAEGAAARRALPEIPRPDYRSRIAGLLSLSTQ